MRPKWLLTMPDGALMFEKAISQLNLNQFERVVLICLREHLDKYVSEENLIKILNGFEHKNIDLCILDQPTRSQSQTVVEAISRCSIAGAIYIKDCDNTFAANFHGGNEISVLQLCEVGLIDAKNKSYVTVDSIGNVTNIVEKQVISNFFCCGGYGFESTEAFIQAYESIEQSSEIYISHVIYKMLLDGQKFGVERASNYIDWGTLREYRHYCKSFVTIFCDIDGVIFKNGSKFGKVGWKTEPISENLNKLFQLQQEGRLYLVITTSRPDSEMQYIKDRLSEYGIKGDKYVMGLPHSKRILINDYSATNPFPSAFSINIERDGENLSTMLEHLID
jgi:hypothetical protein